MSEKLQDFRQLKVWQQSHRLALEVYKLTQTFPADEKFGVISQMRRAAVSIAANIVEGFRRRNKKEKRQFYSIAQSSADELLYFFILCKDLGYIKDNESQTKTLDEIVRMLSAMIKRTEQ